MKPAFSASVPNSNCSKKRYSRNCCEKSRNGAIGRCGSGALAVRRGRNRTRFCDADLRHARLLHYLRNPLPFEMPTPKPLIPPPWKVEILASDINYSALLTAQQGIYTEQQMEGVDYTLRLRYFDKLADKYVRVAGAQKSGGAVRLSQSEKPSF